MMAVHSGAAELSTAAVPLVMWRSAIASSTNGIAVDSTDMIAPRHSHGPSSRRPWRSRTAAPEAVTAASTVAKPNRSRPSATTTGDVSGVAILTHMNELPQNSTSTEYSTITRTRLTGRSPETSMSDFHSTIYDPAVREHRIAVIPGDGIGPEVIPEAVACLEAAARPTAAGARLTVTSTGARSATSPRAR